MKWDEIENKLSEYVNYEKDISNDENIDFLLKTEVWNSIENKIQARKFIIPFFKIAALLVIFLGISFLYTNSLNLKNTKISELENEIRGLKNSKLSLVSQVQKNQIKLTDAKQITPILKTVYQVRFIYKTIENKREIESIAGGILTKGDSLKQEGTNKNTILATTPTTNKHEENTNKQNEDLKGKQIVYHFDFSPVVSDENVAKRTWSMSMSVQNINLNN